MKNETRPACEACKAKPATHEVEDMKGRSRVVCMLCMSHAVITDLQRALLEERQSRGL